MVEDLIEPFSFDPQQIIWNSIIKLRNKTKYIQIRFGLYFSHATIIWFYVLSGIKCSALNNFELYLLFPVLIFCPVVPGIHLAVSLGSLPPSSAQTGG